MLIRCTETRMKQHVKTWVNAGNDMHFEEIKRVTWWVLCIPVLRYDVVAKYSL